MEEQKDFTEARKVSQRLTEMRQKQAAYEAKQLQERQKADLKALEERHKEQMTAFEAQWAAKFQEHDETTAAGLQEVKARQRVELDAERERLDREIPVIPKHSKELPRLRKLQENLTRRKDYEGANKVQREIEALSVDRTDEWVAEKNAKVARQLDLVKKRQETELQNFKKK